ncbi:Fic family protein [Stenotrophomonas sp. HMWF022]|uniref:Fic family protein n=1 Tax=Stenotrophomonas sp. HMWF023 TaxID=2056859 RepID=UPI000D335128|nr:Fic family protein [Stenotrophomonas sp. HMWF023]PTS79819.1 Fic family protein [Stenotrophomonas sp. HMWF023]PTT43115.1 Fic family protein [Stenotrophomonas sp. HMWF022]
MKLPVPAPQVSEMLMNHHDQLSKILSANLGPEVNGVYEHWDKLRHRTPPAGLTSEEWWLAIRFRRSGIAKRLPLVDGAQMHFMLSLTDSMQRRLHFIDREAAGAIKGMDGSGSQGRFLIRSLIEEAMTSSQLEGAATTRAVAKEMLSTGRPPRDQSERMIYNNYVAMNMIRERGVRPITPEEVLELHSILTDGTLEADSDCGRFRTAEDNVVIYDRGSPPTLLHVPPPASQVPERLAKLCEFVNDGAGEPFIHPVVRAIVLHFQIGYDHPFVDGNGRTARALFYWAMMNAGYWLTEYLSISSVLKKSPAKYMRAYLYTESDGQDVSYFVAQQLEALEESIQALHAYIAKKNQEDRAARRVLRSARVGEVVLNHRQRALLANALKDPDRAYTVASHQAAHTITYPTALSDLNALVGAGLLIKQRVGKANEFLVVPDLGRRLAL